MISLGVITFYWIGHFYYYNKFRSLITFYNGSSWFRWLLIIVCGLLHFYFVVTFIYFYRIRIVNSHDSIHSGPQFWERNYCNFLDNLPIIAGAQILSAPGANTDPPYLLPTGTSLRVYSNGLLYQTWRPYSAFSLAQGPRPMAVQDAFIPPQRVSW